MASDGVWALLEIGRPDKGDKGRHPLKTVLVAASPDDVMDEYKAHVIALSSLGRVVAYVSAVGRVDMETSTIPWHLVRDPRRVMNLVLNARYADLWRLWEACARCVLTEQEMPYEDA